MFEEFSQPQVKVASHFRNLKPMFLRGYIKLITLLLFRNSSFININRNYLAATDLHFLHKAVLRASSHPSQINLQPQSPKLLLMVTTGDYTDHNKNTIAEFTHIQLIFSDSVIFTQNNGTQFVSSFVTSYEHIDHIVSMVS